MGEFAPIQALGGGAIPVRSPAGAAAAVLAPVQASSNSGGPQARMDTGTQAGRLPVRGPASRESETGSAYREQSIDDFTLIGPSPAFQANVLELERDLRRTIERLEAERSRVEAEAAIKIERAEAEADAAQSAPDRPAAPPPPATVAPAPAPTTDPGAETADA